MFEPREWRLGKKIGEGFVKGEYIFDMSPGDMTEIPKSRPSFLDHLQTAVRRIRVEVVRADSRNETLRRIIRLRGVARALDKTGIQTRELQLSQKGEPGSKYHPFAVTFGRGTERSFSPLIEISKGGEEWNWYVFMKGLHNGLSGSRAVRKRL